ncbi:MAG: iron ABC transporter permease [Phyllobacteriaceae bacterium]|nr:iron ABC transporter permease [Phyllobacteriaceae bacterium]
MSPPRLNPALAALALAGFLASLLAGPAGLSLADSVTGLFAGGSEAATAIMRDIRLPRALLGVSIGFALGLSGAALQGLLRNPMAEPGVIGVSAFSSLGAVAMFYTGVAGAAQWVLPAGALAGALVAVAVLVALVARRSSTLTLVLAGIALGSLANALTALALNLSPNPFAAYEIMFWLLGSLADRSMAHVAAALPLIAVGAALLFASARALDALSLGEEAAESLGVNLARSRILIVVGVALCVGAGVAVAGTIGFVGLVTPHLVRPLTSRLPGATLLPAALAGAALLTFADAAVRLIVTGRELNVGVATALIGAPFFLWLVTRSRREAW